MSAHTRISLRRFFVLFTYIALLMFLVVPSPTKEPYSQPLTWAYYFAKAIPDDPMAWHHGVAGIVLLMGTISPLLLVRWWTIIPAVLCGALYALIGYSGALQFFTV